LGLLLWGVWRIGLLFPTAATRVLITIALLSNCFLLDFLGLSRGYGLGLGFTMLSLSFFLQAGVASARDSGSARRPAGISVWLAFGAAISTMAFVHFYVGLWLVIPWLMWRGGLRTSWWASAVALGVFYFYRVLVSRSQNLLYFGGDVGFVHDTVGSLVRASFYDWPVSTGLVGIVSAGLVLVILLLAYWSFRERIRAGFTLSMMCILGAAICYMAHALLHVKYPVERAMLYFVPLVTLDIGVMAAWSRYRWARRLLWGLLLGFSIVGLQQANLTHTLTYRKNADIPSILLALEGAYSETGRHVVLAHGDGMKWAIWYYAEHLLAVSPKPSTAKTGYLKSYGWLTVYEWRPLLSHLVDPPYPLLPGTTFMLVDRDDERWLAGRLDGKLALLQYYPASDLWLYRLTLPKYLGTYTNPDGSRYSGEFKDGQFNGQGTCTWLDGAKYVGEFQDDQPEGQGTYTWPDGSNYVGEFKEGKSNGQGTLTFADGRKYVGEFEDDQENGQGTYTWPNGRKYVGEFKKGEPNGRGALDFADGRKYEGEFQDDQANGQGTLTFPDGSKYVGEFKNTKADGQGTLTFADGRKFVGQFKEGQMDGKGEVTYPDGKVEDGLWRDGKFVGAQNSP
jgi:hypothetical protein